MFQWLTSATNGLSFDLCWIGRGYSHAWHRSLQKLARTVRLASSDSLPSATTTGLPEGDPLAVPAMAVLGWLCTRLLAANADYASAFADNWQWRASDAEDHIQCLLITERLLKSLKLHSDPAKCWAWGTTQQARSAWKSISRTVFGRPDLIRVTSAERDLGIQMHYTRQMINKTLIDRLECAKSRLTRLKKAPFSLQEKARLILTNILPTAFYGAELVYLGADHYKTFRTAIGDAMIGRTPFTNPWLMVSAVTRTLLSC